jgi:hypothetical protein
MLNRDSFVLIPLFVGILFQARDVDIVGMPREVCDPKHEEAISSYQNSGTAAQHKLVLQYQLQRSFPETLR